MKKISSSDDIAFKKIFGVEENKDLGNKDLLMPLINSIVGEADPVTESFKQDLSILDIKTEGVKGKRFNIEIQI